MLMGGSVGTSCALHVLLSTCGICPGLCALERASKNRFFLRVSTYKNRPHTEKPRKSSYPPSSGKNFVSTPRELECSDRAQTSTTGSGRPSCVDVVIGFWLKVLVRRYMIQNRRKMNKYTYACKAPIRGVGCSPQGDAGVPHAENISRHPAVLIA